MSALSGSVPAATGTVRFSWPKAVWLWSHLSATFVLLPGALDARLCAVAIVFTYFTLCLGHSVGLHRGLIHRSYRTSLTVQRCLLALFVFTGLGGPLSWIRLHFVRDYWQRQPECPAYFAYRHGILRDFYWNLHGRFEPRSWERYAIGDAILRDPFLRFLERTWWFWNLAFYAALFALAGFEMALVCGVARVSGGIVGHWFIGYWTHKHGTRRFVVPNASENGSNSLVLGWISFGEGFHNNHHALPDSARMGIEPWEFDLGWLTIRGMEKLAIVHDVKSWGRGTAQLRGLPAGS